jgi:hypothetical protein
MRKRFPKCDYFAVVQIEARFHRNVGFVFQVECIRKLRSLLVVLECLSDCSALKLYMWVSCRAECGPGGKEVASSRAIKVETTMMRKLLDWMDRCVGRESRVQSKCEAGQFMRNQKLAECWLSEPKERHPSGQSQPEREASPSRKQARTGGKCE